MFRITGFVLGMVVVLTALLLLLQPRDMRKPGVKVTTERLAAVEAHVSPWSEEEKPHAGGTPPVNAEAAQDSALEPAEEHAQADTAGLTDEFVPGEASSDQSNGTGEMYLFWSPFRSMWAARGFADRLAIATEVPVEVIETDQEGYRVGFEYRDDLQRRDRVQRIESITGLQLE